MQNGRLAGKRVLVFGGMGFLGTNLSRMASGEGAVVTIADRAWPTDAEKRLAFIGNDVKVVEADVREASTVSSLMKDKDVVYCFAGLSGAVNTNRNPLLSISVSCIGYLNILEAARELGSEAAIVFPSSWLVYGRCENKEPVTEKHGTRPISIYGVHKLTCEYHSCLYHELHGLNTVAFRISNPYGPFQGRGNRNYGIVNNFINSALLGQELVIFGDGEQLRDYIYIEDLVELLILAGLRGDNAGEIYNVGYGMSSRLVDVAEQVVAICASGSIKHVAWPEDYLKVEPGNYRVDVTKVRDSFGWSPCTGLEEGLRRTVRLQRESSYG